MKKTMLLAVMLGGVSFSSMASSKPNKTGEPTSRAITQKIIALSSNQSKNLKPQDCQWESYVIGCGGAYDYMGHAYCCSSSDLIFAKMTTFEQYCGG